MDDRVTRVKEILGLRRVPIKVGFFDAPPPALARWSGGPAPPAASSGTGDGGQELLHRARRSLELRDRQLHPQDRTARRSRQRAARHDRVHDRDALPRPRRGPRHPDAGSRAGGGRLRAGDQHAFKGDVGAGRGDAGAVDAGVTRRRSRPASRRCANARVQPAELRDPAVFGEGAGRSRSRSAARATAPSPALARRGDVHRRSGRALGRGRRPPARGAAIEPDDGQLLPGAAGEVRGSRAIAAMAARAGTAGGGGAGGGARLPVHARRPRARGGAGSGAAASAGWRPATPPTWTGWRAARPSGWIRRACCRARDGRSRSAIAYHRPAGERARPSRATRAAATTTTRTATGMKALRKRLLALDADARDLRLRRHRRRDGEGLGRARGPGLDRQERLPHQPAARVVADAVGDVRRPRGRRLRRARTTSRCGDCTLCLRACPDPGVPRARRGRRAPLHLLPEHREPATTCPPPLRRGFRGRVFGCDVCQDVCPFNHGAAVPRATPRFAPRPLAALAPAELAALSRDEFERLAAGMALARAQYDGLRRNALLAHRRRRATARRAPVVETPRRRPEPDRARGGGAGPSAGIEAAT